MVKPVHTIRLWIKRILEGSTYGYYGVSVSGLDTNSMASMVYYGNEFVKYHGDTTDDEVLQTGDVGATTVTN